MFHDLVELANPPGPSMDAKNRWVNSHPGSGRRDVPVAPFRFLTGVPLDLSDIGEGGLIQLPMVSVPGMSQDPRMEMLGDLATLVLGNEVIARLVPPDKRVYDLPHLAYPEDGFICDNYATHKHAKVKAWRKRNPRFHFHFTPTSASWLNMVERFFRDLTVNQLRRGVFHNVPDLTNAIDQYVAHHNDDPKTFVWTATASDILEKVKRGRAKLDKQQSA